MHFLFDPFYHWSHFWLPFIYNIGLAFHYPLFKNHWSHFWTLPGSNDSVSDNSSDLGMFLWKMTSSNVCLRKGQFLKQKVLLKTVKSTIKRVIYFKVISLKITLLKLCTYFTLHCTVIVLMSFYLKLVNKQPYKSNKLIIVKSSIAKTV